MSISAIREVNHQVRELDHNLLEKPEVKGSLFLSPFWNLLYLGILNQPSG
jgi:hypothetical protein